MQGVDADKIRGTTLGFDSIGLMQVLTRETRNPDSDLKKSFGNKISVHDQIEETSVRLHKFCN
jgi:hypothetical protein